MFMASCIAINIDLCRIFLVLHMLFDPEAAYEHGVGCF